MPSPHSPSQNHLLAALPTAEFERLAPHLELVPMPLGEILYEPGGQMQHGYFPTTAIVSLHGLNIYRGAVTCEEVAEALGYAYTDPLTVLT
jgi:hypothetical protein